MKKTAYYLTISLVMLGGLFVGTAQAQSSACPRLVATIPFEFRAGKATLPAGDYEIQCTSNRADSKILQLNSRNKAMSALIQTSPVQGKLGRTSKLVFYRYGNDYFLAQLWMSDERTGMQMRKTDHEQHLSKEIARTRQVVETLARAQQR